MDVGSIWESDEAVWTSEFYAEFLPKDELSSLQAFHNDPLFSFLNIVGCIKIN